MKLMLSIKAILKHRVSLITFCIFLLFNCFQMISAIQAYQSYGIDEQIKDLEFDIVTSRAFTENNRSIDNNKPGLSETERWYNNNYYDSWDYTTTLDEQKLELLKAGEDVTQITTITLLNTALSLMDTMANEEWGNGFVEDVFPEELAIYEDELKYSQLPYDSKLISQYADLRTKQMHSDPERNDYYQTQKKCAEYYFYLLDHGLPPLELTSFSPWSYLVKQIGKDSLLPLLAFPIALIYAMVYLHDSRQKDSLKLLMTQGTKRSKVLINQFLALLICYLGIFLIALAIPTIIIGFLSEWQGINIPVLMDLRGLSTFTQNLLLPDVWNDLGLSSFLSPYISVTSGSQYFIVEGIEFVPLWTELLMSLGLFILKIGFAISLGMFSILCFKRKWQSLLSLFIFLGLFMFSQSNGSYAGINAFAFVSCYQTIQGGASITTLNAYCLALCACMLAIVCTTCFYKNADYDN